MLNEELKTVTNSENEAPARKTEPLTYGTYMRVPELLALQTPLGAPPVPDEMLFIIVQQIQELWFKQMLYDLKRVVNLLEERRILEALPLIARLNHIIRVVGDEVGVLERMPPTEFHRFRHVLTPSSGFESYQFRELELASGLNDPTFIRLLTRHIDVPDLQQRWPTTLHDALLANLATVDADPVRAVVAVYQMPGEYQAPYLLCEALSEYEIYFSEWRFRHIKLVERAIGDVAPGTGGSSGAGYLGKTLTYRFFPELWEARNRLTAIANERG
jgi:tryptophan 2,3-dioxygenase